MKKLLFLFACVVALASCGEKEDPYTREQKEIDEYFSSEELNVYKAFKVSVRGTKAAGEDTAFDKARAQLFALTGYLLEQAADTTKTMSAFQVYETVSEAKPAIDELIRKDEDTLPTVMENISYVMADSGTVDPLANLFTESEEHLILSGLWLAGAHGHPALALYELNRVKSNDIRDPQFKCLAEMSRSLLYLTNKWPYHAEESADAYIAITEAEKEALIASPWPMVDANGNEVTPEQSWHQLHALGFVLRGTARYQCEDEQKKEKGLEDMETFITEAEAGGLDHKVVDLVGLLVALEKEDSDKATLYIEKLEARPDLTQEEKDLIAGIRPLVEEMKADEAKETIDDNNLLPKFASGFFAKQFMNMPVVKKLNASEAGQKFISITEIKAEELLPDGETFDNLRKDAEGFIDKMKEESKNSHHDD